MHHRLLPHIALLHLAAGYRLLHRLVDPYHSRATERARDALDAFGVIWVNWTVDGVSFDLEDRTEYQTI